MPDRNKIKPRRSYTANSVPLTTDLETHEMAVRWTSGDPAIFTKDANGQIVTISLAGGGGGGGVTWVGVPASETASGAAGQLAYDAGYLYVCVSSNLWARIPFPTWDGVPLESAILTEAGEAITTEAGEAILF